MITISDAPTMWVHGERCGLGSLRCDLVELYWQWENELRVMTGNGRQTPESLDGRTAELDSQLRHSMNQARWCPGRRRPGRRRPLPTTCTSPAAGLRS